MKVALLLSGNMTDWTVHYVYFKRYLLDHYDIDVFISTWKGYKVDEIEGVRPVNTYNPITFDVQDYERGFENTWSKITEPFEVIKEKNTNLNNCMSMWYKTQRVNELKNEYQSLIGVNYDLVIKTRPDLKLEKRVVLEKPKKNTLYIPKGWDWSEGINDLFAYGNSKVMDVYSDLFSRITYLMQECNIKINPEVLLKNYINNSEGIKLKRPLIDMTLRDINIKETYNFPK